MKQKKWQWCRIAKYNLYKLEWWDEIMSWLNEPEHERKYDVRGKGCERHILVKLNWQDRKELYDRWKIYWVDSTF